MSPFVSTVALLWYLYRSNWHPPQCLGVFGEQVQRFALNWLISQEIRCTAAKTPGKKRAWNATNHIQLGVPQPPKIWPEAQKNVPSRKNVTNGQ